MNGRKLSLELTQETKKAEKTEKETVSAKEEDYRVYSVAIGTVEKNKFVFEGVGMGHGVGMSQKGAQAMAQLDYSYEEILHHYYTDITIED